jgi:hypothetical protein
VVPISSSDLEYHVLGDREHRQETTHVGGAKEISWSAPECGDELTDDDEAPATEGYGYFVIPRNTGASSELRWQADLSALQWLTINAAGKDGYVVHGGAGLPEDARMRVAAIGPTTLLVDVQDDRLVRSARRWIHADHLEIWGTSHFPQPNTCLARVSATADSSEVNVGPAWQWGIMLDGALRAGVGRPPANPSVEVAEVATRSWGKVLRFRLEIPLSVVALSVMYSDSDDGTTQERIIGTSRVRFRDAASFGKIAFW